ncbi:hypothetical protein DFJ63DRAFT_333315 [Scheffersomyces coipomensis]|uniref:uncharacterized protein n=1 Tax=Scheffersomyces coipomensis TaxID=1788519 RepID=UPI00315D4D76
MSEEFVGKDLKVLQDLERDGGETVPILSNKSRKQNRTRVIFQIISVVGLFVLGYFYFLSSIATPKTELIIFGFPIPDFLIPSKPQDSVNTPSVATSIIYEIQPPIALTNFESYNTTVIFDDEELADGLTSKFHHPAKNESNFDGAYLTLNFTNKNVITLDLIDSFAVIEISIDEFPVWRTSTPYGKSDSFTFSSTYSNITDFISLLNKNRKFSITVLEGSVELVDVSLSLTLTKSIAQAEDNKKSSLVSAEDLFVSSKPPTKIYPLVTENNKPFNLPNVDQFKVTLPKVSSSTTIAKLNLFVSVSKEEIGYFKNDDDPLRHLNIFINDVYVNSIIPKPTLYHSDSLTSQNFDPVVDFGNFVGLTFEIDLINVLPTLWADESTLEIFVTSPINGLTTTPIFNGIPSPITKGENQILADSWFVSGNLFLWNQSDLISNSTGIVSIPTTEQTNSGIFKNPPQYSPWSPATKNEIAKNRVKSNTTTQFQFTLKDNSTVSYTVESKSELFTILTKSERTSTRPGGPIGQVKSSELNLVYISTKDDKFDFIDNKTKLSALKVSSSTGFPINLSETKSEIADKPDKDSIKASFESKHEQKLNGEVVDSIKVQESVIKRDDGVPITNIKYENNGYKKSVEVINGHPF